MKKLLLIGDSIRIGYQPVVQDALRSVLEVVGPRENCGTSTEILENFKKWILDEDADFIHMNCGMHDVRINPGAELRQTSLPDYVSNLRTLFSQIQAQCHGHLTWATITPLIQERHQAVRPSRRHEVDVAMYNAAALSVAHDFNLRINDLHDCAVRAGPASLLSEDGIHFTEEGYRFLGGQVAKSIYEHATQADA